MGFSKDQLERLNILPVHGNGRRAYIDIAEVFQRPQANSSLILKAHDALIRYHQETSIVPITMLAVTCLVPTHDAVWPTKLKKVARERIHAAIVWQYKRKYYILSGHHDIVASMLLGHHKVAVRVVRYA